MHGRDSEVEIWSNFVFELVIWPKQVTLVSWTQPLGPLCLWQCFRVSLILWWHLSLKVLLCVASNYQFMEFIDIIPDIGVKPLTLRVTLTPILAFIRPSFHHLYRTKVRSYSTYVSDSVTHSLTTFWKLNELTLNMQTMQTMQTVQTMQTMQTIQTMQNVQTVQNM